MKRQFKSGDIVLRRYESDIRNTGNIIWFSRNHRYAWVCWSDHGSPKKEALRNLVSPREWHSRQLLENDWVAFWSRQRKTLETKIAAILFEDPTLSLDRIAKRAGCCRLTASKYKQKLLVLSQEEGNEHE